MPLTAARKRASEKRKRVWPFLDPTDPRGLVVAMRGFLEAIKVKGFSERTLLTAEWCLSDFIVWCQERAVCRPQEVTKPMIERYQRMLFYLVREDGRPLTLRTQNQRLSFIKQFFKWLAKNNHILGNPASEIELPKLEQRLPKHVLTAAEAERVLAQPDITKPNGVRDRAILETFYSTGARRSEVARLKVWDLDAERGTVMIRQGKWKKDRLIPIGERASAWIEKYLREVRPGFVVEPDDGTLFLSSVGDPISIKTLTIFVARYVTQAEIGKKGSCHLFRHTMATLMLENGADIRFIQQMLGHVKLTTTEIYTQVSIKKLKEIHTATHPGARLHPPARDDEGEELVKPWDA